MVEGTSDSLSSLVAVPADSAAISVVLLLPSELEWVPLPLATDAQEGTLEPVM